MQSRSSFRILLPMLVLIITQWSAAALAGDSSHATRREMIVSTGWLASHLDGRVVVIEVGNKDDYETAHIPTARLLERHELLAMVDGVPDEIPPLQSLEAVFAKLGVGEEKRVVFYSRDPLLATRAWFTFDYLGHGHRASVLNGGFVRWTAEGKATTTEVPDVAAATFTASPNPSAITTLTAMKTLVRTRGSLGPALLMIDARPDVSYRGDHAGAGIDRAGHIPGAVNVYWRRNLDGPNDDALFRSDDELRNLYEKLGANRGTTIVAYCRTGLEASMTYFVLRYLGFDPSLYDGSFVEWSCDPDTPVI